MGPPAASAEAPPPDPSPCAFSWSDEGTAVVVRIRLPKGKGPNASDNVSVDAGGGGLVVTLVPSATSPSLPRAEVMRVTQLYGTVDASKATTSVSKDGLEAVVTLPKLAPDERWPSLEVAADDGSSKAEGSAEDGPAAALAERENVAALLNAARSGDLDALKVAAEKYRGGGAGDDVDGDDAKTKHGVGAVRDGNGRTALHFAAVGKSAACVEWLLDDCGVDVNALDDKNETPLAVAAALGDAELVRVLLAHGADAKLAGPGTGEGETDAPSSSSRPNSSVGVPPLCRAAASGSEECVRLLIAAGADPCSSGGPGSAAEQTVGPPLFWAAGSGDGGDSVVKALLEAGADPKKRAPDGVTALLIATASENVEAVRALLAAGADPNAAAERGGVTPLHVAAETGDLDIVESLLAAGASPDAEDEQGTRAIEAAACCGDRKIVEALFPVTTKKISGSDGGANGEWSVDGIMERGKAEQAKRAAEHRHDHGDGCGCGHSHGDDGEEAAEVPEPEEPDAARAAAASRAGDEAFVRGDVALAFERYSESLRHATDVSTVWSNRAAAALRGGSPGQGVESAERARSDARVARSLDPTNVKAWFREGRAAEALGDYEGAARCYFSGFQANPGDGKECAEAFQRAVAAGREAYKAAQEAAKS